MKQIYLDNGATSFPKAPGVGQAMKDYIEKVGVNINRSSYRATAEAALSTLTVREDLCRLFGAGEDLSYAIFTSGVTMSLNMIMKGALHPGDHLIISGMEHNAVARPATQLEAAGVAVSIAPCDGDGVLRLEEFEKLITPKTRLVVMQYASNVSGTIQPMEEIGAICRRHGVLLAVDSAQAAGHFAFDMRKLQIDALCFTGHKGLLGPSGIGGFVMNEEMNKALTPLIAGGTGSMSASLEMPPTLPDRYEAGTPNLPGIMGLGVALRYLQEVGLDALHRREMALTERFLSGLRGNEHIRIPGPADAKGRVGVISVDFLRQDNAEVAFQLEEQYGILTRCGLHCAPLAHKTLGTYPEGTVRFSIGYTTTEEEVDAAIRAIHDLAYGFRKAMGAPQGRRRSRRDGRSPSHRSQSGALRGAFLRAFRYNKIRGLPSQGLRIFCLFYIDGTILVLLHAADDGSARYIFALQELCQQLFGIARIHGDEQAAGGLRIVQDILQIQRDAFGEAGGRPGKLTVAVGALRDEAHFGQGLYPGQYRHLGAIDDDG